MSRSNVEKVRDMYAAFNRGDVEAATEMLHDDAELHQPPEMPGAGTYVGRDEFVRGLGRWLSGFEPGFEFRVVEVIDAGDGVLMRIAYHGRGRTSGVELEQEWFNLWEIRDGKPFRCVNILDEGDAFEAAGLPRR
jgi:uncharacterized protein